MWMSGAPGVGKSAIAQTVSEELCGDDGSASWFSRIVYRDRYALWLTQRNSLTIISDILMDAFSSHEALRIEKMLHSFLQL